MANMGEDWPQSLHILAARRTQELNAELQTVIDGAPASAAE